MYKRLVWFIFAVLCIIGIGTYTSFIRSRPHSRGVLLTVSLLDHDRGEVKAGESVDIMIENPSDQVDVLVTSIVQNDKKTIEGIVLGPLLNPESEEDSIDEPNKPVQLFKEDESLLIENGTAEVVTITPLDMDYSEPSEIEILVSGSIQRKFWFITDTYGSSVGFLNLTLLP